MAKKDKVKKERDENVNKEIFPNGPTENKLAEWKAKYGDEVYMSEFGEDKYIFRPISRLEYKKVLNAEGVKNVTELYNEEKIMDLAVLWPENINHDAIINGKAGVPTKLTDQVMSKSGFVPTSGPVKL